MAVFVLLAVRAGLPYALRPLLASQASQALDAHVEIGDVGLSLLRCGIALNEVTIRPTSGPAASAEEQPMVAWKRFAIAVRWLPLFQKRVLLREVIVESPRVAVDRGEDGKLNILALVPARTPPPAAGPTPVGGATPGAVPGEASSNWRFGADRLVLRNGGLRFRDFRVKGAEPLFLNLPEITLTDIAPEHGIYGEPSQSHVAVNFEGGSLDVRARLTQREDGQALTAEVTAQNIPLHRAPYYLSAVGWRTLDAWLDTQLTYRFDSKGQNEVRGTVAMRDVVVRMPNVEMPAIEYRLLKVTVDPLDFVARRVHVNEIAIDGATSYVGRRGGDRMPLLTAVLRRGATGETKAPAAAGRPAGAAAPAPSAPWHWSVTRMHVRESRIRLLRTQAPLDVGVDVTVSGLADDAERPGTLQVVLTVGKGSVTVDGQVRLARLGFAGTVRVVSFPLAELMAAAAVLPADLLQAAELGSELTVEAGMPTSGSDSSTLAPGELRVRGGLSLSGLRAASAGAQGFSLAAKSIDLGITELRVPGVVPGGSTRATPSDVTGAPSNDLLLRGRLSLAEFLLTGADAKTFAVGTRSLDLDLKEVSLPGVLPGPAPGDAVHPMRVALGALSIAAPSVRLTRTTDGIALPTFSIATAPDAEIAAKTASAGQAEMPDAAKAAAATRPIEVTLETLRLADGTVALADRTVQPFFEGKFARLRIVLRGLRWPPLAVENLRMVATSAEQGKITVAGSLDPKNGQIELKTEKVALPQFNPYATTLVGYSIGGGKVSIVTTVTFDNGRYDARNALTLHNLDLRGVEGESLFQQTFGIPLSMALALLRDTSGDIALGIPVRLDTEGVKVGVGTILRGALRRAIMGALASPLKLMGAVFGGGKVESLPPTAIGFRVGRSEFAPGAAEQVEQIAALLASRPVIAVTLATATTPTDVRWLREQALLAEWEKEGFFGKLRGLPQRGARNTISAALQERARYEEGPLDPDDAATLDRWLDERPAIPESQLRALTEARLVAVERVLREQHGLQQGRVKRSQESVEGADDGPAVRLELGAVGSP